ncbi:hypothetical protein KDD17_07475 [Sulfitobacter albidus]|uniref:SH3 domain-containing protein n=1 Tax=Sulfitobacter albidus TaxID=2829501 RepID=A0A975JG14_9RHOB|nr:hypothetical protein [Sulfitobacter albidus]QUJ77773.1 hypothetical protein KDD17_07475 [Sulfitobacter albidus]
MTLFSRLFCILAVSLATGTTAQAQSQQELIDAFAGEWYIFDPAMRAGAEACNLTLTGTPKESLYPVSSVNCAVQFSKIDNWKIVNGQILLMAGETQAAALGGNQFRVTGDLVGSPLALVIERAAGDGNSQKLAAALRRHKCYYAGFSQRCATPAELRAPEVPQDAGFTTIETLANLNTRAQPRRDAPALGTVATGTQIKVNQCLTASDGPWCRARVGDQTIWLAMTAIRQDEWPVVTYKQVATADE